MNEYLEEVIDREKRIEFRCDWLGASEEDKESKIVKLDDLFPEGVEITESLIEEKCKEWATEYIEWSWG